MIKRGEIKAAARYSEAFKMQLVRELGVSMTENNHCAENALAERMNGILKPIR